MEIHHRVNIVLISFTAYSEIRRCPSVETTFNHSTGYSRSVHSAHRVWELKLFHVSGYNIFISQKKCIANSEPLAACLGPLLQDWSETTKANSTMGFLMRLGVWPTFVQSHPSVKTVEWFKKKNTCHIISLPWGREKISDLPKSCRSAPQDKTDSRSQSHVL